MTKAIRFAIILGLLGLSAMPCFAGERQSGLDLHFGTSFKLAREAQILNPRAGKDLKPVEGMSGSTTMVILDAHRKSFERKQKRDSDFVFEFVGR